MSTSINAPSAVETAVPVLYIVIDRHTGLQVGCAHKTRVSASRKVDRLDNAYGAYRYSVRRQGE